MNYGLEIAKTRKANHLTQSQLGYKIGLSRYAIGRIERGTTRISREDYALILEAMGVKKNGHSINDEPLSVRNNRIALLTSGVAWFAESRNISFNKAFSYLKRHKGIDFLMDNFRSELTLSKTAIVRDIAAVCSLNGGKL